MSQDVLSVKPLIPESNEAPRLAPIPFMEQMALEQKRSSGANWFLWIAGLSLINSLFFLSGSSFGFVVGLSITQIVDYMAIQMIQDYQPQSPMILQGIAFFIDLAIIGMIALFGLLARRGHGWAFIVGMVLYLLDTLLTFYLEMWLSAAFHAFALFGLWGGYQANRLYTQYKKAGRLNAINT
jgi:hypothetical protein